MVARGMVYNYSERGIPTLVSYDLGSFKMPREFNKMYITLEKKSECQRKPQYPLYSVIFHSQFRFESGNVTHGVEIPTNSTH